jgi:hypothetical protein
MSTRDHGRPRLCSTAARRRGRVLEQENKGPLLVILLREADSLEELSMGREAERSEKSQLKGMRE